MRMADGADGAAASPRPSCINGEAVAGWAGTIRRGRTTVAGRAWVWPATDHVSRPMVANTRRRTVS